jgi:hypothetical protein
MEQEMKHGLKVLAGLILIDVLIGAGIVLLAILGRH